MLFRPAVCPQPGKVHVLIGSQLGLVRERARDGVGIWGGSFMGSCGDGVGEGPQSICYKSVLDSCSSSGNWQAVVAWQLDPKDMVDPLLAGLSRDSDARILY